MAKITLRGNPFNTNGELPAVGTTAPDFRLVNGALEDMTLASFDGKKKVLSILPSLDTPTCATSTRKFNEQAAAHEDTVVLVISADLPFAMGRFCTTEGIEGVTPLSMMRGREFAENYGVLITDGPLAGVTARAVLVLDEKNVVRYSNLVSEVAEEPSYDDVLAAL